MNYRPWRRQINTESKLSRRKIGHLIAEEDGRKVSGYLKNRLRTWMIRKEFKESKLHLTNLCRISLEHIFAVTSPIALISQVQHSGGLLLSRLFDGHPEVHAHPDELRIGYPKKYVWPRIDLDDSPKRWFGILFEDKVIEHFSEGYNKDKKENQTFPFIFIPSLQRKIFLKYIDSVQTITLRHVFDAYMTSYFGSWLNNQNYVGRKKFITAFTPGLLTTKENMELFFEVYPDGRLISLVRNPKNWYLSDRRNKRKIKMDKDTDIRIALCQWKENTQATRWNKKRYGERVCIIRYEDLINDAESVMHYLAEFLGIGFDRILLTPTFNKSPITAGTSFETKEPEGGKSTLDGREILSAQEQAIIAEITQKVYQQALRETVMF
jgi:hypothetical protein